MAIVGTAIMGMGIHPRRDTEAITAAIIAATTIGTHPLARMAHIIAAIMGTAIMDMGIHRRQDTRAITAAIIAVTTIGTPPLARNAHIIAATVTGHHRARLAAVTAAQIVRRWVVIAAAVRMAVIMAVIVPHHPRRIASRAANINAHHPASLAASIAAAMLESNQRVPDWVWRRS